MMKKIDNPIHAVFKHLDIEERCTWPGTKWDGTALLDCGEPTIGAGLFCDPTHEDCGYYSLCKRHASRPIERWDSKASGWKVVQ